MAIVTNKEFDKGQKSFSVPNGQSRLQISTAHWLRLTLSLPEYMMEFCNVTLTFESAAKLLWCDHPNETSSAVLSHGTIYIICFSNFWVYGPNPMMWPFKWNLLACTFTWYYLFFKFHKIKFGNLVEICFWLNLAVKGLKHQPNAQI